jgi:hypothetical protein
MNRKRNKNHPGKEKIIQEKKEQGSIDESS